MGKISTFMIATVLSVAAAAPAMSQMTEKQKKYQQEYDAFWGPMMEQKNREYRQRREAEDAARATPAQQKKEKTRVFYNGENYYPDDPGYSDAQKAATARFNERRKGNPPPKGYLYSLTYYRQTGALLPVKETIIRNNMYPEW
jgi:hypothetical protein